MVTTPRNSAFFKWTSRHYHSLISSLFRQIWLIIICFLGNKLITKTKNMHLYKLNFSVSASTSNEFLMTNANDRRLKLIKCKLRAAGTNFETKIFCFCMAKHLPHNHVLKHFHLVPKFTVITNFSKFIWYG